MANRNELFEQREKLSKELNNLSEEYNQETAMLRKKFVPKINELTEKIDWIRNKLYDLGVAIEDC